MFEELRKGVEMSESDWESLEGDLLELLSDTGVSAVVEDTEELVNKLIMVLRRRWRESTRDNSND